MIRIFAISNGRQYGAQSKEKPERLRFFDKQPASFEFRSSETRNDRFFPATIKIACQSNDALENDSLQEGRQFVRSGSFEMHFHELLDVCLDVLENDGVTLHHPQFNRLLRILADQHSNRKKFR